jgi:hypothetical protein
VLGIGGYRFSVSNVVQLVKGGQVQVVTWHGQLEARDERGMLVCSNVYRLDDGFWDYYYEHELHSA